MGSIGTHGQITNYVVSQLTSVRSDEEYTYLELGNFLTDISQLRDPYACIHAKGAVFRQALDRVPIPIFGLPAVKIALSSWMPDLLGVGRPLVRRQDGVLTQFLILLAKTITHAIFAEDSPISTQMVEQFLGFDVRRLKPTEVDRVFTSTFTQGFTQYYPHEHLDYPPYRDPDREDARGSLGLAFPDRGRLIAYLQDHVQYVVEELTKIEIEWLNASRLSPSSQARRDVVRRLGHILHSIEDYFFHSNFAEIYQWQQLTHSHVERRDDYKWLALHDLDGSGEEQSGDITLRRRMARRLRYPAFDRGSTQATTATYWDGPSRARSKDAKSLVYTGGFGRTDIFHSIYGFVLGLDRLRAIKDAVESAILGPQPTGEKLALNQVLFNIDERRKAARDKGYLDSLTRLHDKQLVSREYPAHIQRQLAQGKLSPAMASALQAAFDADSQFRNRHRKLADHLLSTGGFLIVLLVEMQKEVDDNQKRVDSLGLDENSIVAQGTYDGASAETIGTHSLMAKDTHEEAPLRKPALALAKHASASIALLMAKRVTIDSDPHKGLDWDSIVRYFLRFPKNQPGTWETAMVAGAEHATPSVDAVADKPNFRMLGPDFQSAKLQQLRQGTKRPELEQLYRGLELLEDR